MKKALSIILSIAMLLSITAGVDLSAYADEFTTGSCGENVTYSFDSSTGTLTISGTGNMTEYIYGNSPFSYTSSIIKTVIINSGVTSIGESAFYRCTGLTSIEIPNSVTSIGKGVFYGCTGLTSIKVDSGNTVYDSRSNCNAIIEKSSNTLIAGCKNTVIPNSVTSIGRSAFSGCIGLTSITIPNSVTSIGYSAFSDCAGLTSITIPNSVTSIGIYAFYDCTSLKDVYYSGSEADWNNISIERDNEYLTKATIHFNSTMPDDPEIVNGYIHNSFYSANKKIKKTYGYYYSDDYFSGSATTYNQSLATMSLCLAFSTYQTDDGSITYQNAEKIMKDCNYYNVETYGYNKTTQKDGLGAIISSKEIDGETLISVAVRSGGYGAEWASNLKMDSNGDHFGFDQSADKLEGYISSYVQKYKLEGSIKIWITGYSRGAAVATQTAAKLDNSGGVSYTVDNTFKTASFNKNSIYAYGFATPAGAIKDSNPHSSKYSNIFSIIGYNDPVPLVAPAKWKFDRYGTTKLLPYRESNNSTDFKKYYKRITDRMGSNYKVDSFKNYTIGANNSIANAVYQNFNKDTLGTYNKKLVNALADTIGTRQTFYSKYQADIMKFLENKMGNGDLDIGLILQEACNIAPKMSVLHPNITITLVKNLSLLADVHANQDYYLAWMQSMDPNYEGSLPLKWGDKNYRTVKANCPVDVRVYDSEGTLVAAIINEVPQEIEGSTIVSSIDENDQKVVYLPVSEKYNVQITARKNCEVTYSVDEFEAEYGEQTKAVSYIDVNVNKNEAINSEVEAFTDDELESGAEEGSSAVYTLSKNGNELTPDLELNGAEEIEQHTYTVDVIYDETQGEVYGGGSFTEGSFAKLEAQAKDGYAFDGFYVDGVKLADDDLDGNANTVRLEVKGNTTVEARFKALPQPAPQPTNSGEMNVPANINPAFSAVETIAPVTVSAPKLKKAKAGKKSFTATWAKVDGATGYEVQYSTNKKFKKPKTKAVSASKAKLTVKKLKSKKTYYVRVRSVNGAAVSPWSKTKKVKAK